MPPSSQKFGAQLVLCTLLSVSLYMSGFFVVLTPLPLLYVLLRGGRESFVAVTAFSFALVALVYRFLLSPLLAFYGTHPGWSWLLSVPGMNLIPMASHQSVMFFGFVYYLFFVVVALLLERASQSNRPFRLLGLAPLGLAVCLMGIYMAYAYAHAKSPLDFPTRYFNEAFKEMMAVNDRGAGLSTEQTDFIRTQAPQIVRYSVYLSPAIIYCSIVLMVTINFMAARRLFLPLFPEIGRMQMHHWRFPFATVWGLIISLGLLLVSLYGYPNEGLFIVTVNVIASLVFLYYLQGFTIISWFLQQKGVRAYMRAMIYMLILFLFQPLGVLVVLLGLADEWVNVRKLPANGQR